MKHPRRQEPAFGAIWTDLREQTIRVRGAPTPAEAKLWSLLRSGRLDGLKFRRQQSVERFIVDFYCVRAALIVEVDGRVHDQKPTPNGRHT